MTFAARAFAVATLSACAGMAMAQPVNDNCATATTLSSSGTYLGTVVAATPDGTSSCFDTAASPSVWYKVTVPSGGNAKTVVFSTCNTNTQFDTVLSTFSTCGGAELACSDNSSTCTSVPNASRISTTVQPGETIYCRVASKNGVTGTFRLVFTIQDVQPPSNSGPDVIVGDLSDGYYWGAVGTQRAYSIGTTSCNIGDTNLLWIANTNQHPVIGQNLYRIQNNRFEQIGNSWLKHGFTALTQNLCATCSGQGGAVLGVGCSDPYVASLNGDQGRLGPRSHVNATNGFYPYPFTAPGAGYIVPPAAATTIGRRMTVNASDLFRAGAVYVGESQYVSSDDAVFQNTTTNTAINGLNNVSYRLMNLTSNQATGSFALPGSTVRMQPALKHWQVVDPTVVVNSYDYMDGVIKCRYWVGAKVVNNNDGTWDYIYAVFNLNSDRNGGGFSVPAVRTTITSPLHYRPLYHSGEPTTFNDFMVFNNSNGTAGWTAAQTFAQNPNAGVIRWGTTHTFSLRATTPPTTGSATLSFHKVAGTLEMPGLPVPSAGGCPADFNADTIVDFFDYLDFVAAFSANEASSDFNADTTIDFFDYLDFVAAFSGNC
ncbi:MAG: hypothetical protein KGS45_03430 [Planctomycetes bacterium]|nr:hypothetical protein [Planctomycetota bacterium]